jgi:DamX protein
MSEERSFTEALGLTHDPFSTPSDSFFAAGDRTRQLDELRQFSRGRRRVLAVTGDWGVGKSVMFRALSSRLDPGVKAARINASLVNDVGSVLSNVIQGFGLAAPERSKVDAQIEVIVEHARAQGEANRYCLVMVDDAHALELRALETLLAMVDATPKRGLRVVFFGEARFVQSLEKAIGRAAPDLSWHEIRLGPFSRDEVRRYLSFRLQEAGWDDQLPFTALQIQELTIDSGGHPGEIDRRASQLLSGEGDGASTGLFPPMHRAVLMLVGVVVGMIWLVWQFGELTRAPATQPALASVDRSGLDEPRVESELAPAVDPSPESRFETGFELEPALDPELAPGPEPASEPELFTEPLPEALPRTEFAPRPGLDPDPPPEFEPELLPEPELAALPEPEALLREPPPEPELAASPELEPLLEPEPLPEPEALTRVEPASYPDPRGRFDERESTGPELRPGAKGAGWLMRQSPERYTLQLFGTSSLNRMVTYVNRQQDISEFALLTIERDGEPWYIVTYGLFSTPGAARTAAENLPSSVGRVDPWVRRVESVQAHIRQLR